MSRPANAIWSVTVSKQDLVGAVGAPRKRDRRRKSPELIIFAACENGLSVESGLSTAEIPASGNWHSPVAADSTSVRKLAPLLGGSEVQLSYRDGKLALNTTSIPAREV